MFFQKKKTNNEIYDNIYDKTIKRPVMRCSICTGEKVAGFKNIHTNDFEEIMLIRNEQDLELFREMYHIDTPITKEY